jgi:hypothetical protein
VAARARDLQAAITSGTTATATVERMIRWMDLGEARPALEAMERQLEPLRAEHLALYPKRATAGAPVQKALFEVKPDDPPPGTQTVRVGDRTIEVKPGTEREVLQAFGDNWFTLKKALKANTDAMSTMWRYRKGVCDTVIADVRRDYYADQPEKVRNVGSATLESDIDVGLDAHGKTGTGGLVEDWRIVDECNKWFQQNFGREPGILFDINFYANAPALDDAGGGKAKPKTKVEQDMEKMAVAGQDVGALMKMRRYMDAHAWQQYQHDVLASVTDAKLREATLRQFEEADAKYLVSVRDLLEQARKIDPHLPAIDPEGDPGQVQHAILEAIEHLEHQPEVAMRANNALYVKRMEELRELSRLAKSQSGDAQAATLARIATLTPDATFFANEAYHADSTFQHVVGAGQKVGKDADAKFPAPLDETGEAKKKREAAKKQWAAEQTEAALAGLSANDFLQSFNEQLGDLMKDLKHYQSEPFPGLGFYRCSKYMERALDALAWIRKRYGDAYPEVKNLVIAGKAPEALKGEVAGGLVLARKGVLAFQDGDGRELADDQRELEAYAIDEVKRIFGGGVTTLGALGALFSKAGATVNAALRKAAAGEAMKAGDERAYFR